MIIKNYNKAYNKYIIKKHLDKEKTRIENIENIIILSRNLQDLINNLYKNIYHIEQKHNAFIHGLRLTPKRLNVSKNIM